MTRTAAESFTLTNAKVLASKVTADMRRCQQIYGQPADGDINDYGTELALLLRDSYVRDYEFGFLRNGARILSWSYAVDASGQVVTNDRPGRLVTGVDIANASFFNRINYTQAWWNLSQAERDRIKVDLPVQRVTKDAPPDGAGRWVYDLHYSSGGVTLGRKTFQPFI